MLLVQISTVLLSLASLSAVVKPVTSKFEAAQKLCRPECSDVSISGISKADVQKALRENPEIQKKVKELESARQKEEALGSAPCKYDSKCKIRETIVTSCHGCQIVWPAPEYLRNLSCRYPGSCCSWSCRIPGKCRDEAIIRYVLVYCPRPVKGLVIKKVKFCCCRCKKQWWG